MQLQIDSISTLDLKDAWEAIDRLEDDMALQPGVFFDPPVVNTFTDHLYSRQTLLPKGTLITSEIHLTEHQYDVMVGVVAVWTPATQKWTRLDAPDRGITTPGTRRVLYALEDTCWVTYHVLTDQENIERDVDKIIARILDQPHRAKFHPPQIPQCHT